MIAYAFLKKLETLLVQDQGNAYRTLLRKWMPLAEDAYRENDTPFREHLGASLLGRECERAIWYGFHWATEPHFDGRMLRLFNRGHLEEGRLLATLELVGCTVWQHDENGNQFMFASFSDHMGGALDCVARGVPGYEEDPCLSEFKTHGEKSFTKLAGSPDDWRKHLANPTRCAFMGEGVREAKFEHFVQMQLYMGKWGLKRALYLAVNKNADDIYAEIVPFDAAVFTAFDSRAAKLISATEPPKRVSENPSWYLCKFCDAGKICHSAAVPAKNCRTCRHSIVSTVEPWTCHLDENSPRRLDKAAQLAACPSWAKGF